MDKLPHLVGRPDLLLNRIVKGFIELHVSSEASAYDKSLIEKFCFASIWYEKYEKFVDRPETKELDPCNGLTAYHIVRAAVAFNEFVTDKPKAPVRPRFYWQNKPAMNKYLLEKLTKHINHPQVTVTLSALKSLVSLIEDQDATEALTEMLAFLKDEISKHS